jgi:hypothetical protein
MGEIKSALEIALERTKNVTADKSVLEVDSSIKEGKKLVSKYLDDAAFDLDGCFKNFPEKQIQNVKDGMFQALVQNLFLPKEKFQIKKLKRIGEGFLKLIKDTKRLKGIMDQLEGFFTEYTDERERVREMLEKQFAKKLQKKEEALSKQLGSPVHLNPASDPEFHQYLTQTYGQLEERYNAILVQVKEELDRMFRSGK